MSTHSLVRISAVSEGSKPIPWAFTSADDTSSRLPTAAPLNHLVLVIMVCHPCRTRLKRLEWQSYNAQPRRQALVKPLQGVGGPAIRAGASPRAEAARIVACWLERGAFPDRQG